MKNMRYILVGFGLMLAVPLRASSEELSSLRTKTRVSVYNFTDFDLKSTFKVEAKDSKSIANDAYYPNNGAVIVVPPTIQKAYFKNDRYYKPKSVDIAQLARNRGIENGKTYLFYETIDLPGLGPVLKFTQKLKGTFAGSDIEMSVNAPGNNGVFFSDDNERTVSINAQDGRYVVTLKFWGTSPGFRADVWIEIKYYANAPISRLQIPNK